MDEKDQLDDQQIESQELDQSASEEVEQPEQEQEVVEAEAEEQPEPEEEPKPSRRENLRIQQLLSKLGQQQTTPQPEAQGIDYRQALDADPEVYKQLESDRQTYGTAQFNQGLQQAQSIQFHTRLEIDAPKVTSKYPQFDPESPTFNPVAANAVNQWYLQTAGYNPKTDTVSNAGVRYSEFVDSLMELADEMAGQKIEATKKNIAKQAASTGLRPDGSSAKRLNLNRAPESMTDEELDAVIASSIPQKR